MLVRKLKKKIILTDGVTRPVKGDATLLTPQGGLGTSPTFNFCSSLPPPLANLALHILDSEWS